MENFSIDYFELSFLAEACIPPRPIARAHFWNNLTDVYWEQMSENQRKCLFEYLTRNIWYRDSLETEEDTQIFHARFDPNNQYTVFYTYHGRQTCTRAFYRDGKYWNKRNRYISQEFITNIVKIHPDDLK